MNKFHLFLLFVFAFICFLPLMLVPTAVFWVCWSWYGLGEKYFNFLPEQFHVIPFWDIFLMMVVVSIVGRLFEYKVEVRK